MDDKVVTRSDEIDQILAELGDKVKIVDVIERGNYKNDRDSKSRQAEEKEATDSLSSEATITGDKAKKKQPAYELTPLIDIEFQRDGDWGLDRKCYLVIMEDGAVFNQVATQIASDFIAYPNGHPGLASFSVRFEKSPADRRGYLTMAISKCHGSLFDWVNDKRNSEKEARAWFVQILALLDQLQKCGREENSDPKQTIALLDIQPLNIVYSDDSAGNRQYKLVNLKLTPKNNVLNPIDTSLRPIFVAPELAPYLQGEQSDFDPVKSAIFSLGMSLGNAVLGFSGLTKLTSGRASAKAGSVEESLKDFKSSQQFLDLVSGMVEHDWQKRMTIENVLTHPWVEFETSKLSSGQN